MSASPAPGATAPAPVLLLGDPGLRRVSVAVRDLDDATFRAAERRLHATLAAFRAEHGFGRAIAAPQIGVPMRFVALHLDGAPSTIVNPEITWRSRDTFTLWDDCMSFPSLLVRVRRHAGISVRYVDGNGEPGSLERLDRATSELLQHELDHLDGVLAVDRALDREALVTRSVFEAGRARFEALVDGPVAPRAPPRK